MKSDHCFPGPCPFWPFPSFMAMLLLLIMVTGCTTQKAYNGPYREPDELAYIQPDREKAFTHVKIISVDTMKWDFYESRFAVLPGQHTMTVNITLEFPYLTEPLWFTEDLIFEAQSGKTYTVHGMIEPFLRQGATWITADTEPDVDVVRHTRFLAKNATLQ